MNSGAAEKENYRTVGKFFLQSLPELTKDKASFKKLPEF